MLSPKQLIAGVAGAAVSFSGLAATAAPAQANPAGTGLVISEVYGGGGNSGATLKNDFVELYNPTAAPISVAGMSVQYRSATGTTPPSTGGITQLSGSVPAGGHYLVQMAAGTGGTADLPTPDAVGEAAMSGSGGVVLLVSTTTAFTTQGDLAGNAGLIDMVGYGSTPTSYENANTGVPLTSTTSAFRDALGADTDHNANDFTEGEPTPTASGVGSDELTATAPADLELTVDEEITPVQLAATGGEEPYAWAITAGALPGGVSLSTAGELSGTPGAVGEFTATATVTDDGGATDDVELAITVVDGPAEVTIADVQGTPDTQRDEAASPLRDKDVIVEGIVTGVYADPYDAEPGMANYGGLDGFYLQTAGTGGATDATPEASDAVFVRTGNDLPADLEVGDSVQVAGTVDEYQGLTQIVSPTVTELETALPPVSAFETSYPTDAAGREALEGMLLSPTDTFTVTNSYATNQYGEVGLATGDTPLLQPTDVARPGTDEFDAVVADNAARLVTLDDATSINYLSNGSAQQDFPMPWLSADNVVRVGAEATLEAPVLLDYRNNLWKFLPQTPVLDEGTDVATFEDTRALNEAPQQVGGDVKLATFNVLNYFNTTGEDFVANGGTCSYYNDRDGNPIGTNTCTPNGPRGAANDASLARQQAKIVNAINTMEADVVSLEELENSIKLLTETDRDDAIAALVEALNADAGAGVWSYVASPAEALTAENVAEQDVIRNGFIYRTATVEPVGESDMLFGSPAFTNAREPLAQVFKPVGGEADTEFAVVVNHFKSKGCSEDAIGTDNADAGDGQSCYNGDRVRQATALAEFIEEFQTASAVDSVFITGDLNSYTQEDPMQVLYEAGYGVVESDQDGDWSYSFSGLSGSLDHVLANPAAMETVTGADVWEINANESVGYQYSRYNYNVTQLYADDVFAASDHNPEIVGISTAEEVEPVASTTRVKVTPKKVVAKKTRAMIKVTVRSEGEAATGAVKIKVGKKTVTKQLRKGKATVRLAPFKKAGKAKVTVRYVGDDTTLPSSDSATITVTKAKGKKGKRG